MYLPLRYTMSPLRDAPTALLFSMAAALLLVVNARQRRAAAPRAVVQLRKMYANIRAEADKKADEWPHASAITSKLDMTLVRLRPPEFTDGHGPIGAYAMLDTTAQRALLNWCKAAFDDFINDLREGLTPHQLAEFERLVWVNAEASYHTCVSVSHEHPSLLADSERPKWKPVQGELRTTLAGALRDATGCLASPRLTLDSISITADGAFIVGFCDDASASFDRLREVCVATALKTLGGELTSRPKSLIHVTIGRLLGAPTCLTAEQRARIAATVRRHNNDLLPGLVASAAVSAPETLEMRVGSLSLVRDRVWWMTAFDEYATWPLGAERVRSTERESRARQLQF